MSSTTTRTSWKDAMEQAERFRDLFSGCCDRWEIAGSLRRKRRDIGDIEHVVIPHMARIPDPNGLFSMAMIECNLLWNHCDELVAAGTLAKHEYLVNREGGAQVKQHRWGDAYRGIDYGGITHEIFTATPDNWGCILTIRTGPGEFSKKMVMRLHDTALRQDRGHLRYMNGAIYPCDNERVFFQACRAAYVEPEDRK